MLARRNTIRRVYRDQSETEIDQKLRDAGLNRRQFDQIARQVLPPQAALYDFLATPPSSSNQPKWLASIKRKEK